MFVAAKIAKAVTIAGTTQDTNPTLTRQAGVVARYVASGFMRTGCIAPQTRLRKPSVATSRTYFFARLIKNSGIGARSSMVMSKRTRVLPASGAQGVLDMLSVLLKRLIGVPDHPVAAPVVFEQLLVGDAHHPVLDP